MSTPRRKTTVYPAIASVLGVRAEYFDPYFPHLSAKEHSAAKTAWSEKRASGAPAAEQLLRQARPLVREPPTPVAAYARLMDLPLCRAGVVVVRGLLRDAVDRVALRTSDSLLAAGLQWLTVAVHRAVAVAQQLVGATDGPGVDSTATGAGASVSGSAGSVASSGAAMLERFAAAVCEHVVVDSKGSSAPTTGTSVVSYLRALLSLPSVNADVKEGAAWCLRKLLEVGGIACCHPRRSQRALSCDPLTAKQGFLTGPCVCYSCHAYPVCHDALAGSSVVQSCG